MPLKISCLLIATVLGAQTRLHSVHLNSIEPDAAISYYTKTFGAERRTYRGSPAVWANGTYLLIDQAKAAPKAAIISGIWHIGWGGGDNMKETYRKQIEMGTRFHTPLTDLSDQCDGKGGNEKFFFAYVDGPDHALIELNTTPAGDHKFGHVHLLSEDPVAAAEWYMRHFGLSLRSGTKLSREVRTRCGRPTGPSAALMIGQISFIIYPAANARAAFPSAWKDRTELDSSEGHVIDSFTLTVPDLKLALRNLQSGGVKVLRSSKQSARIEGPDRVIIELIEE